MAQPRNHHRPDRGLSIVSGTGGGATDQNESSTQTLFEQTKEKKVCYLSVLYSLEKKECLLYLGFIS